MSRRTLVIGGAALVAVAAVGVAGGLWYHQQTAAKEVRGSATVEFEPSEPPLSKPPPPKIARTLPWPTYGYDEQRTHLSPYLHRPPFRRLWTLKTGWYVEFPPAVGYGKVFVSQLRGKFYAVDAETGEWRWRRQFPFCSAATPALTAGLVIQAFVPAPCTKGPRGAPGLVVAMRQSDGRTVWRARIASETSPLVVGDRVYVGSWDHSVYAIDIRTGRIVWRTKTSDEVNASPAYAGGTVYVGDNSGTITALAAQTGSVRWRATSFSNFTSGREYFYATPSVAYGRVYAANTDGTVYAFGAHTGNLLWARHVGTYVYTAPAIWNRRIYVGTYDGAFLALDAATGDVRWRREMPAAVHGAPTVMDGLVYFSTCGLCGQRGQRGAKKGPSKTFALDALTGKLEWTFPDGRYSPVVADEKRVYLTGSTWVYGLQPR